MGIDKTVVLKTWTLYIESVDPIYEADFEGDVEAYSAKDAAKEFRKIYSELGYYYTEFELIQMIEEV